MAPVRNMWILYIVACLKIVLMLAQDDIAILTPNDICDLEREEGTDVDCDNTRSIRFYHAATPDPDNGRTGCLPLRYKGCGANYNNYVSALECVSYCQTYRDLPLRSDIKFTVQHDAPNDEVLLAEEFRRSLFPNLAAFCGHIPEHMVRNVWVASGEQEQEIDIGFRIEDGNELRPYECTMAFTTNLDNGYAVWTYDDPDSNDVINLSAIPTQRVVNHYAERASDKDSQMLLILLVIGLIVSLIALMCIGCLLKAMKSMKRNIQNMRKKLIMGGAQLTNEKV